MIVRRERNPDGVRPAPAERRGVATQPANRSRGSSRRDEHDVRVNAVVYVVDDDPSVCRALYRLIRSVNLDVVTFASATAFLDYSAQDRPACLVLDVRLPGPSGLDLQSTLIRTRRDVPIVFITAHADVRTTVRAMKGGAVDFLEKPLNDQELLDCIQLAIARSRQQRADRAEHAEIERRRTMLTRREREVLALVVTGRLNKEMAAELGTAEKTFKVHRGRVMKKMRAVSVADLIRMAEVLGQRPMTH